MTDRTYTLPPHAGDVLAAFGFPHGADEPEGLWWRSYSDGSVKLFAQCSDFFDWGSADLEEILEEDVPLLWQCLDELKALDEGKPLEEKTYLYVYFELLFAARKRNRQPMKPWRDKYPKMDPFWEGLAPNRPET